MRRTLSLLAMLALAVASISGCILLTNPPTNAVITMKVGQTQTLSVIGFANTPYEWSKNGAVLPGSIEATYIYTALPSDLGLFKIQVKTTDTFSKETLIMEWYIKVVSSYSPIANAGPDQYDIPPGAVVNLDGSASRDPEGLPLTYTWSITTAPAGSTATIINPNSVAPRFIPDQNGGYTITLIVNDGEKSATDTVNVSVSNGVPTANAGDDQRVLLGNTASLDGRASSDPNSDPLTYAWEVVSHPDGSTALIADPTSATPTFTPDIKGVYILSLIVTDDEGLSSPSDTMWITVYNDAPIANAGIDININLGQTASFDGSGSSDPNGTALSYSWEVISWPDGSAAVILNPSLSNPTLTPDRRGAYTIKLTVSDSDLTSEDTVTVNCSNNVPIANAGADQTIDFGQSANLNGSLSSDPDGDALSFAWTIASGPDTGISQLSSSIIANPVFTPSLKGVYTLRLIVTDSEGLESAPDEVVITTLNHRPVADAGDDIELVFQTQAQLSGSGSDADGDPITYQWRVITRPSGSFAQLSDATAPNPSITPDVKGKYELGLIVNDGELDSIESTLNINVYNNAPTAIAGDDVNLQYGHGDTVYLNGGASFDTEDTPLSYQWTITSYPFGSAAVLSNETIVNPSITPDLPGTYIITLVVFDGDLYSNEDSLTIVVTNSGPTANAGPDQAIGFPGVTAYLDGRASSDPEGNSLSFSWAIASRPSGSTASLVNPASSTPSLTPDREGVYTITLVVSDGIISSSIDSVNITAGSPPVANAGSDIAIGFPGTAYLNGSGSYDPNGPYLSYAWTITTRPPGSTATLSNPAIVNPSLTPDMPGTYVASLVVYDGTFFSAPDTVTITSTNQAPVANAGTDIGNIHYNVTVTLDGSGSYDPDGSGLSYAWTLLSYTPATDVPAGTTATITNPSSVSPTFRPDKPGIYVIRLIVNDGYLSSTADTVTLTTATLITVTKNWDDNQMGDWSVTTADGTLIREISTERSHSPSRSYDVKSCFTCSADNTTIVTTYVNFGSPGYVVSVGLWQNWYPVAGLASIDTKLLLDGATFKDTGPDDPPTFPKNTWAYRGDTSTNPYAVNRAVTTLAFAAYDFIYIGADEMFFDDITYIVWR